MTPELQCGPKWIATQLPDTRLTPERVEGSNESLEQKHEEEHQGQAYKQGEIVRGHGPVRFQQQARNESPALVTSLRGGVGKAPRRGRVVAAKTAFVPQRLLRTAS